MPEEMTREHPIRGALLSRRFDADDAPAPGVRPPRRARIERPTTEPPAAPQLAQSAPAARSSTLTLGSLSKAVLDLIRRGGHSETKVVGITPTGAEVPLQGVELRDTEGD